MASAVEYVNRALVMLGAEKIQALTPADSPNADSAIDVYDSTVNELLAEHSWRFATGRKQLSQLSTGPSHTGWQYQYALPADTLRIVRTDRTNAAWDLYRDENTGYRRLYSNETIVWADIVRRPDPALFPPHFQRCLVLRLAAALAMPVTRRVDFMQAFETKAEAAVSAAVTQDWNEAPWPELDDGNLIADARYGD